MATVSASPHKVGSNGVRLIGRAPGLDGLRAVAVIVVFVSHLEVFLPLHTLLVVPGGTVGLDPFFVLSGFLITALLLKEQSVRGSIGRWSFYERRIVRLLPPLLFLLIANVILAIATHAWNHSQVESLLSVTFYYSNYYAAHSPNVYCANLAPGYQHLWSLSFEEQFYLVWPWIVIAFLSVRQKLSTVVITICSAIVVIGVVRGLLYHGVDSYCSLFHSTQFRADALLWGCLAAHLWVRAREPQQLLKYLVWPAAIFLLACLPFSNLMGPFLYRGGFDAIDSASAVILLALIGGYWVGRRLFEWTPLVKLGLVAYGFYLWHLTVFYVVSHVDQGWNDFLRLFVATAGTILMTLLSWFIVEKPLQIWVHKRAPRVPSLERASTGSAAPATPNGPELVGPELVGPERNGPERNGPELVGPERVGPERDGHERVSSTQGLDDAT
jgi:peptidoglycan/LPS O-acetylase OafA/YrhL